MDDTENLPPPGEEQHVPAPEAEVQEPQEQQPEPNTEQQAEAEAKKSEAEPESEQKKRPRRDRSAEARIGYFTAQLHHERQLREELERRLALQQESTLSASESNLTAALSIAETEYKRARNEGDLDAEAMALRRLSQVQAELHDVQREKRYLPVRQAEEVQQRLPRPQQQPTYTPRTAEWRQNNPWYESDPHMTKTAQEAHEIAIKRGMAPDTDEYWNLIDRRVRNQYPEEFADDEPQQRAEPPRPAQRSAPPMAPVHRAPISGQPQQQAKITLTKEQVDWARQMGTTPQKFAAQLKAEQSRSGNR